MTLPLKLDSWLIQKSKAGANFLGTNFASVPFKSLFASLVMSDTMDDWKQMWACSGACLRKELLTELINLFFPMILLWPCDVVTGLVKVFY